MCDQYDMKDACSWEQMEERFAAVSKERDEYAHYFDVVCKEYGVLKAENAKLLDTISKLTLIINRITEHGN